MYLRGTEIPGLELATLYRHSCSIPSDLSHAKTFDFEMDSGNLVSCFERFHASVIIDTKNRFLALSKSLSSLFTGNGLSGCLRGRK